MDRFSEKSLLSLGEYYVYGLIDSRSKRTFYIGKGTKNRVFEHEKEAFAAEASMINAFNYVGDAGLTNIVAVYKPSEWFVCKEAKDRLPRQDIVLTPKTENRLFFVDERYEQGFPLDEN